MQDYTDYIEQYINNKVREVRAEVTTKKGITADEVEEHAKEAAETKVKKARERAQRIYDDLL